MTQVKKYNFSDICRSENEDLYNELYKLCYHRSHGYMKNTMSSLKRTKDENGQVYLIRNRMEKVIAWSLIFYEEEFKSWDVMFFTHRSYRRRGLCKKIFKGILRDHKDKFLSLYPESYKLFQKYNYRNVEEIECQ